MRNFLIIARREYLERVRTKSFIIITLLLPILMIGATVVLPRLLARGSVETKHFVIVASNASTAETLRDELKKAAEGPGEESRITKGTQGSGKVSPRLNLTADISTDTSDAQRTALTEKVNQKQLDGVIFGADDSLASGKISFYTRDISSLTTQELVREGLTDGVRRDLLTNKGLTGPEIDKVLRPVTMDVRGPAGAGNPVAMYITVLALVMIMYIAVMI